MNVKRDTKEKFTVLTLIEPNLSAIMTEELEQTIADFLDKRVPHIVLNLHHVENLDETVAEKIASLQQKFYEQNASFIVCELQPGPEALLDKMELLELMNITPTESEAWDIIQMEEIERELTSDDES